jgi:DNA adenine methylase
MLEREDTLETRNKSCDSIDSHQAGHALPRNPAEKTKPATFLRWAGCKRKLLPRLSSYWSSEFTRYVEPFAGSSSLFFKLEPPNALLADKNADLIEVYCVLRDNPGELHARVSSLRKSKERYYKLRALDPRKLSRIDRAVRFLYLNRYCFNGIYRTNLNGQFNVPYAPSGTGGIPALEQFLACSRLLNTAMLHAWDFGTTLRHVGEGDFVYIDPPYAVESRRVFVEYGPRWFSRQDLARLAEHLKKIDRRGATFLVSYAECREARALAKGWHMIKLAVQRNIAGFHDDRRRAYELTISNKPLK